MQLTVSDLSCSRGGREVFSELTLSVAGGEALLVTGPNGAGKTSLLRTIAGLVRAGAGTIALQGGEAELTVPEQCHFLGHIDPVKPTLTVAENLHFWVGYLRGGRGAMERHPLDAVDIRDLEDLPAGYLSAGQRRRLSLARLVAIKRPVWLLDEPTSALDSTGHERFVELARKHLAGGGIIVAATHAALGLEGARELRLGGAPS